MYEGRELFPNAPLAFVTAEIRLAYEPEIIGQETRDHFATLVRHIAPVLDAEIQQSEPISQADGTEVTESVPALRASTENELTSIALTVQALTVETAEYVDFDSFSRIIDASVVALRAVAPQARVRRVGLRYIDEIRVPGVQHSRDWLEWIAAPYVAPLTATPGYEVDGINGAMAIPRDDDCQVFVRWGEIEASTVLNPDSPLKIRRPEPSRLFVLDLDSAWAPDLTHPINDVDFNQRFADLHSPIGTIFMSTLTDNVKRIFRGE